VTPTAWHSPIPRVYLSTSSAGACGTSAIGSSHSTLTSPIRRKAQSRSSKWKTKTFQKKRGERTILNLSTALRSQRSAMPSSTETARESRSSVRPRPMALATSPLLMATRMRAATSEAAASGYGKRTCGSRSFLRPSATDHVRSITRSGAKC
jgi:hypothetical protein